MKMNKLSQSSENGRTGRQSDLAYSDSVSHII
jgi:hypothetical protein